MRIFRRSAEARETRSSARRVLAAKRVQVRESNLREALNLRQKGYSYAAIARELGAAESTVRGWLKEPRA